jgi:hypothetical protein
LIVCLDTPGGADLPVTLTTAKRTAKIIAVDITRISKKKDLAVNAFLQVRAKAGMFLEYRTKIPVIQGN